MVDLVFAVIGCLHGDLDRMYDALAKAEIEKNVKIDLVLCCGDFQSLRGEEDLDYMVVVLQKYRHIKDFHQYYNGTKVAPYLTVFVGGNHEASNYLWTLPYGGWVAKNIYYMGTSNVIKFSGIKIGGISGIYKYNDFRKGHFENPPFDENLIRSIYNYRAFDFERLNKVQRIDIMLSHDWPKDIWNYGNVQKIIKRRPDLKEIIDDRSLGCTELMELINNKKPSRYFCAHKHIDFDAVINHGKSKTKFLALDKSLPHLRYFEIVTVQSKVDDKRLFYVPEWLAITKLYAPYFKLPADQIPQINPPSESLINKIANKFSTLEIPAYVDKGIHSLTY